VPTIVEQTPEARELLIAARKEAETEYSQAEDRGDPVGTTVWGRANEQARKLALLYAVSVSHQAPQIDTQAAEWAIRLTFHQIRRMLFMAGSYVAENPFHADCLKLLQKLRQVEAGMLPHSVLLKRMKMDTQTFQRIIQTLLEQGDITTVPVQTKGRAAVAYKLLSPLLSPSMGERG
jgi:DNA-binding MarR family transcriptional regulator